MCGILVAYSNEPIDRQRFDVARDTMIHRGPDAQRSVYLDQGRVGLGHTRLSIIDLSERSHQPMKSGDLWVTFNGEIYNHLILRRELESSGCVFTTTSDTEVLLHGFRVWGDQLSKKLLGMFAFAIWDETRESLFLARDHFGQKPLYYTLISGRFVAASEIKAIKQYLGDIFRIRKASLIDAMVQDYVAEPDTWYEDIKVVPAGHQITVGSSAVGTIRHSIRCYWDFEPPLDPQPISEESALERLTEEIDLAVTSHLIADVEVGAFLSGGIDSTCIVTEASRILAKPIRTFSIGFGFEDELPLARETAARLGTIHTEGIVHENDFVCSAGRALEIFDGPFADTSLVATERVSALASTQVKVALTGDGGDECFGGYDYGKFLSPHATRRPKVALQRSAAQKVLLWYWDNLVWQALGTERWSKIARDRLIAARRVPRKRRSLLAPALLTEYVGYDPSEAYEKHRDLRRDPFRDAQWVGIKVPLPGRLLMKVDRCSMVHSLETRAPFLSPRLAEFMLSLPVAVTNPEAASFKGLLRNWLTGKVSPNVLAGPKRGFGLPKTWSAVTLPSTGSSRELFPECVSAALLAPEAWRGLSRAPKLMWYLMQIEQGLARGLLRV